MSLLHAAWRATYFKAGHILGTNPKAQWLGQAFGGIIGAVIATIVMVLLVQAYGPAAFGTGGEFVAAQASVVATMISGIPCIEAFVIGLIAGFILHCLKLPSMLIGLGIYLPFYMSFTAFLGAMAKVIYDACCKARRKNKALPETEDAEYKKKKDETGLVVASGLLGGESIVGVLVALGAVLGGI